jgi:hypothetical protein
VVSQKQDTTCPQLNGAVQLAVACRALGNVGKRFFPLIFSYFYHPKL